MDCGLHEHRTAAAGCAAAAALEERPCSLKSILLTVTTSLVVSGRFLYSLFFNNRGKSLASYYTVERVPHTFSDFS